MRTKFMIMICATGFCTLTACAAMSSLSDREVAVPPPSFAVCTSVPYGPGIRPVAPAVATHQRDFAALYRALQEESFEDDRLEVLRKGVSRMYLSCRECVKILTLCHFDDEKLAMLREMAPVLVDYYNGDIILDSMDFDSGRTAAQKLLDEAASYVRKVPMDQASFERFYQKMEHLTFSDERLTALKEKSNSAAFTCAQCRRLLSFCSFDEERMEYLRLLAPVIWDRNHGELLIECMTFQLDEARKLLNSYRPLPLR